MNGREEKSAGTGVGAIDIAALTAQRKFRLIKARGAAVCRT